MADTSYITMPCTSCNNKQEVKVYNSVNVRNSPELKPLVMNGSIFMWECSCCGKSNLIPFSTLYHDPDNKYIIWYLPNGLNEENKTPIEIIEKQLEDYTLRIVHSLSELMEKIRIFNAGLDDIVMEMCKYVTKMELVEKHNDNSILQAPFTFFEITIPDNDIVMMFPLYNQGHKVNIGFNVYEDCRLILSRHPDMLNPTGFISINDKWLATKFR